MRLRLCLVLALALSLAVPALAGASSSAVIKACTDGTLASKSFSQRDYAKALANLPSDVDEYTDCRAQIQRAQLHGSSHGRGGSGSNGGSGIGGVTGGTGGPSAGGGAAAPAGPITDPLQSATPAERATYAKAVKAGSAPVELDGRPISAGRLGGSTVDTVDDLPAPLLAILVLLLLGGVGATGFGTRRLVHTRRPA
jgi:hypothetical protein